MTSPDPPPGWRLVASRVVAVRAPYRLDLTAMVLRRTPDNPVDVLTPAGGYLRAFRDAAGPLVAAVRQTAPDALAASLYRPTGAPAPEGWPDLGASLGARVDLTDFYARAAAVPGLAEIVVEARGVKPPRYYSLWEAICNAVIFQQVSIEAAMATMRRFLAGFSAPVAFGEAVLYPFPDPAPVLQADPGALRALGLSAAKGRALQECADAVLGAPLLPAEIAALPTPAAMERLQALRGVGPWTAAVILLRGFGRLDVFPAGDSGARRGMRGLLALEEADIARDGASVLDALGPWRGMLYYHLLLWRLRGRGVFTPARGAP
jgi:DNA-3-methyladenine glycosylase II